MDNLYGIFLWFNLIFLWYFYFFMVNLILNININKRNIKQFEYTRSWSFDTMSKHGI